MSKTPKFDFFMRGTKNYSNSMPLRWKSINLNTKNLTDISQNQISKNSQNDDYLSRFKDAQLTPVSHIKNSEYLGTKKPVSISVDRAIEKDIHLSQGILQITAMHSINDTNAKRYDFRQAQMKSNPNLVNDAYLPSNALEIIKTAQARLSKSNRGVNRDHLVKIQKYLQHESSGYLKVESLGSNNKSHQCINIFKDIVGGNKVSRQGLLNLPSNEVPFPIINIRNNLKDLYQRNSSPNSQEDIQSQKRSLPTINDRSAISKEIFWSMKNTLST